MLEPVQYASRHCPRCRTTLSNVQGIHACPDCGWVGEASSTDDDSADGAR